MTHFSDVWVAPWLALLADWSIRWGLVLAVLAVWFALRPPRSAATRYLLCSSALAAGLLMPIGPRWGNLTVAWAMPKASMVAAQAVAPASSRTLHEAANLPVDRSPVLGAPTPRTPAAAPAAVPHPTSTSLGPWRIASLAVAVAWASGVLVLLIRLAGGWLVLARLRRAAVALDCQD